MKYYDYAITFSEFPDEIALCINITNCPNQCPGCSESYLAQDIGTALDIDELEKLIAENPGITLVGFMGGDSDHQAVCDLTNFIHENYALKVGMYSGRDYLDLDLAEVLDYYKIGGWRMPEGPVESWHTKSCGPLKFPFSNQIIFKKVGRHLVNISDEFRKDKLNNYEREIIK